MNAANRRDKLPKWAQQELARLERNLAFANERLATGPEDSRVFADPYSDMPRPLGSDTRIEFRLGDRDRISVHIDKRGIRVMGNSSCLAVMPESGNVVYIETRGR